MGAVKPLPYHPLANFRLDIKILLLELVVQLLHNAKIFTLDDKSPSASAMVVDGGKILAIGEEKDCEVFKHKAIKENLQGRIVIPGLTDAHIHLQHYALSLQKIDCEVVTMDECLRRVALRAKDTSPGEWILGHGWNQNLWEHGFGTAKDLDEISPQNPVYLTAKSLHAGWANSRALNAAHINQNTSDPPDGQIQRGENGKPTGILLEGAMQLVEQVIPQPSVGEIAEHIKTAQRNLWQMGVTSVHDFDRSECFASLQILHQRGDLKLRVLKSLPIEELEHAVALGLRSGFGDNWLRIGGMKAFADGALGPHTAAMLSPYENDPQNLGILLIDGEEIFELGRVAVANGLSLAIHAIGDRANHEMLKGLDQLRRFENKLEMSPKLRHRIEHVQLIHPEDASRLANLDIIASMQPIHAISDMMMADEFWGERAANSYAWRTQLKNGARLAFGSDAPVESPNPFWGLHAAVTRQQPDSSRGENGWYPEQRLTILEAMMAYTSGPAYAAGLEDRLGKLSAGYLADLLVLDVDPFSCDPATLHGIKPAAVMVGGEWVVK